MVEDRQKRKPTVSPATPGTSITKRREQEGLERGIDDMFNEFRQSFNDLMRPFFPLYETSQEFQLPTRYAQVDLIDNGDAFVVNAELPGFAKDQVDVQVNKDGLAIKAECKKETEEKQKNYLHRERAYSSLQRFIAFPEEVDPSKVEGTMKDGILELKVPKKEPKPEEKPRKVELK
ncbi:MAG: Hsp20/alpha crystallin family protein [Candidatus Bathyarchaeia archaeon]|jgi:HSP20 family molecular chaperone IbpA